MEGPGQRYPPAPVGTTAQEARPQPWRMFHGGVWQIWAECFNRPFWVTHASWGLHMPSVPPEPLGLPVTQDACGLGLSPDVLLGAGIPLAMEALHSFLEPCRAGRGQSQALHDAV